MNKTPIEYLTHTWSPISMRCTPVSSGCKNCWHLEAADRLALNPLFSQEIQDAYSGKAPPLLVSSRLADPLRRRKHAIIGAQFMGDLFHEDIPIGTIAAIHGIIAFCQEHTFIILTKRIERALEFYNAYHDGEYHRNERWWRNEACLKLGPSQTRGIRLREPPARLPLPNLWFGVSVENQRYDHRILALKDIPAAVRFISFEPLLGPFDFLPPWLRYIDWAICGCESGPGRRPTEREDIRHLKNQCVSADIPFFLKQMDVAGAVCSMPKLDGETWEQYPK